MKMSLFIVYGFSRYIHENVTWSIYLKMSDEYLPIRDPVNFQYLKQSVLISTTATNSSYENENMFYIVGT